MGRYHTKTTEIAEVASSFISLYQTRHLPGDKAIKETREFLHDFGIDFPDTKNYAYGSIGRTIRLSLDKKRGLNMNQLREMKGRIWEQIHREIMKRYDHEEKPLPTQNEFESMLESSPHMEFMRALYNDMASAEPHYTQMEFDF
jgi:hypothetical protein